MRTLARAAALLAVVLPAAPVAAQAPDPARGAVVERVVSASDAGQSYALYLPTRAAPGERRPLLVLMDPRGQATVPMERFRAAAERNGWIVASSWNTISETDSALAANDRAVAAIVADALDRYGADSTRIYFAGFSGTARYAWALPHRLGRGSVAGIIGVGAGLPQAPEVWLPQVRQLRPFPFWSAAGSTDYNLDEMARLDTLLRSTALPHRFTGFEGGHEWLPAELAGRAVEWLQLQTMALGTAPRDAAWLDATYTAGLEHATALERGGRAYEAWAEYHGLVGDFLGLRDVSAAQRRASALSMEPEVRRERERRAADALAFDQFRAVLATLLIDLRTSLAGVAQRRLVGELALQRLHRQEADSAANPGAARMATRMLNTAFAQASYEGDTYMRARRWRHAASALRVAHSARPDGPGVCWPLARALAQAKNHDDAFEALGCALERRAATRAQVEGEPMLAPLRADPRFAALLSRAASD
jgi:predicted esterase